jgi:hypothetical protein
LQIPLKTCKPIIIIIPKRLIQRRLESSWHQQTTYCSCCHFGGDAGPLLFKLRQCLASRSVRFTLQENALLLHCGEANLTYVRQERGADGKDLRLLASIEPNSTVVQFVAQWRHSHVSELFRHSAKQRAWWP